MCNISDGLGRVACPGETPGAKDTLFLFNRDAATFVAGTGNLVEDVTFSSGEGFYQVVAKKGSVVVREELQDDNSGTNYTHEVDFSLADLSPECRDFVQSMNAASLGCIVQTKADRFILLGYNDGVQMKVNTMSTTADALGEFVTLRETEVNEKTRRFFDTDVTTTRSNITSKIVGS